MPPSPIPQHLHRETIAFLCVPSGILFRFVCFENGVILQFNIVFLKCLIAGIWPQPLPHPLPPAASGPAQRERALSLRENVQAGPECSAHRGNVLPEGVGGEHGG